jgi:macrolide-specific efflux system membrane fusion protein
MKTKLVAVLVLAAVGVGAIYVSLGGLSAQAAATTQYLTAPATMGDVTEDVAATGTLASSVRYGLVFGADPYLVTDSSTPPQVSATYPVTKVDVKVGDTVKKDQVIATADTTDLERQLASAQNSLKSARVSLNAANATRSTANDSGNADQIRQAKIGQLSAQNQVADALQHVRDLEAQIAGATLKAPVDGLVTEVDVQAGFDAPSGNAIVIDGNGFQITTDVVESDLANVAVGQPAAITISALGADVTGKVSSISPVATSSNNDGSSVVSYPVTVTLDSVPPKARSGMTANVTITIASATNVLTVPAAALRGTEGDYRVLTLDANGQPVSTPVTVGLVTNTTAEIKSGIDAGTAVVTGTSASRTGTTSGSGGFGGFGVSGGGGGGPVFKDGGGGIRTAP